MPELKALNASVNADLVVFDKDGTLIDFHTLWGPRVERAIDATCSSLGWGQSLTNKLNTALGYDPQTAQVVSQGPLATAPISELEIVVATILFQHQMSWEHAKYLACEHFGPVMSALPQPTEINPLGDVRTAIARLKTSGFQVAIATSDDRAPTETTLRELNLIQFVDLVLCADDPDTPSKPDSSVLHYISQQLVISIDRTVMVGDTVSDLKMGRQAGVALTVGITGGADKMVELESHADVLLSSIDGLVPA